MKFYLSPGEDSGADVQPEDGGSIGALVAVEIINENTYAIDFGTIVVKEDQPVVLRQIAQYCRDKAKEIEAS